jgi:hypothetical protein
MKKIILAFAIFAVAHLNAQIVNYSFENWATDTSYFLGIQPPLVSGDTFPYSDPVGWTSTNAVTGDPALGGLFLFTQSNIAYADSSSIQLTTDTLKTIVDSSLGLTRQLVVPGLILNGIFPVSNISNNLVSFSTSSITPGKVSGAGQLFTQRLADFKGYYQYTPVLNTFTNSNDTCVMWATLRKGSTIIANAEFKSGTNTNGTWTQFSTPFVYLNCETPDTLVVLLASSLPVFSSIISGNTDLTPGSVLLVDDISYDTLPASQSIVIAVNDLDTMFKNQVDTINVLSNDLSCSSLTLTVTLDAQPAHGTASVWNNEIIYTPTQNYLGPDTIYYTDTDTNGVTSSAYVIIHVDYNTGISEANEIPIKMYPVPASDNLHIDFVNNGKTTARIFDVVGNLISVATFTQNDNNINVSNFTNGVYGLQLLDENSNIIARTKFVVNK